MTNTNPYTLQNKNITIDVSMLYDVSGNDEGFIGVMVQTFLKTMPETIKSLEQSMSKSDWENVYKSAHFAKSSLSVIKIEDLLDLTLQVEVNAKKQIHLDEIPELIRKIKERYLFAEELLNEVFSSKFIQSDNLKE